MSRKTILFPGRNRAIVFAILLGSCSVAAAGEMPVRPLALLQGKGRNGPAIGERVRFAPAPNGSISFLLSMGGGDRRCQPLGTIDPDGAVTASALSHDDTWYVEQWGAQGFPFALAYTPKGDLHCVTRSQVTAGLTYWYRTDGRWVVEPFGSGEETWGGANIAMGLLPDGTPLVLASGASNTQFALWRRRGPGQWRRLELPKESWGRSRDFDMAVLPDGTAVIVGEGGSAVVRAPDGTWTTEALDTPTGRAWVSMGVDEAGRAIAAYIVDGEGGHEVRLAVRSRDGAWRVTTVGQVPADHYCLRTGIAAGGGKTAVVWESGKGSWRRSAGGATLAVVDGDGTVVTQRLTDTSAGRPGVALSQDGRVAYVGVYTGDHPSGDFRLLAVGLAGQAPPLSGGEESFGQVHAQGCLSGLRTGVAPFMRSACVAVRLGELDERQRAAFLDLAFVRDDPAMRVPMARKAFASPQWVKQHGVALVADADPAVSGGFLAAPPTREPGRSLAIPLLMQGIRRPQPGARMGAARGLSLLDVYPEDVIDAIRKDLRRRNIRVAGAAAYALRELWRDDLEATLRADLADEDLLFRARVADLFRLRGRAFSVATLRPCVTQGDEQTQLFTCGVLTRLEAEEGVAIFAAALQSKHASVRQSAVYGLESVGTEKAFAALKVAMKNPDANVRRRAAIVLGRRGVAAALDTLRNVAKGDADPAVRHAGATSAALIARENLAKVLTDGDTYRRQLREAQFSHLWTRAGKPTAVVDGVVQAGSQKQLFVDDLVVADFGGAVRATHRFVKDPHNPVMEEWFPWEPTGLGPPSVYYDARQQRYFLWNDSSGRLGPRGTPLYYRPAMVATSTDGVSWSYPNVGLQAFGGFQATNLVGAAAVVPMVTSDEAGHHYASFSQRSQVLQVRYSPDGLSDWTEPKDLFRIGGDVVSLMVDYLQDGYLAFLKTRIGPWRRRAAGAAWGKTPGAVQRIRSIVVTTYADDGGSFDRIAETFHAMDFVRPERFHCEMYGVAPFVYEGMYLCFPEIFDVSGPGPRNVDGTLTVGLVASRDLGREGWLRPRAGGPGCVGPWSAQPPHNQADTTPTAMAPVIDVGRFGEWDCGQIYPSTPVVVGDEIVMYYSGAPMGHEPRGSQSDWTTATGKYVRAAVGRATLRLDGFVSLRADDTPVEITTRPMMLKGTQLVVNVACAKGSLHVEVLDAKGNPMSGLTRRDADAFAGDALRHVAT